MIYELENTEYQTKDLHLAAYLKLKAVALLRLEKADSAIKAPSLFVFADKVYCESLERLFWEVGDMVDIKEYNATLRDLRSRVASIPYKKHENN